MPSYPIKPNASLTARDMHRFNELNELYDGTVNQLHHLDFSTINISSNEVFTYHKAMKEADAELLFLQCKRKFLITSYATTGQLLSDQQSNLMQKILRLFGVSNRSVFQTDVWTSIKLICALMVGCTNRVKTIGEKNSPVVNMLTVRLILALCNIHKLESKSIDFVLAFPQADLEVYIWMELPIGFIIN